PSDRQGSPPASLSLPSNPATAVLVRSRGRRRRITPRAAAPEIPPAVGAIPHAVTLEIAPGRPESPGKTQLRPALPGNPSSAVVRAPADREARRSCALLCPENPRRLCAREAARIARPRRRERACRALFCRAIRLAPSLVRLRGRA